MFAAPQNQTTIPWYSKGAYDYVNDWFLMDSPVPILAILTAYLTFVLKLGPALMKTRPAFQLRAVLIVYNLLQVLFSLYLFIRGSRIMAKYGLVSSQCLLDGKTSQLMITEGSHIYLMAKVCELMDTLFFVLRKKNEQVTFLHVFHHSTMVLSTWSLLKYFPNYSYIFSATVNAFMHIIMYSYYGLALFSSLAKHLWWKKYVTLLELIHLVLIVAHLFVENWGSKCHLPYAVLLTLILNVLIITCFYVDFYIKKYVQNNKNKQQ